MFQDITGKDIVYFMNKLDKVLAFSLDVPRCNTFGHSYDRNFHNSNSLCDHYRNVEIKHKIDYIAGVSLAVLQDGHAPATRS